MIIHVTQHSIDHGDRGLCSTCPVALEIRKFNPELKVSAVALYLDKQQDFLFGEQHIVNLPIEVQEWIADFDTWIPVKPFSFHLSAECFMR